ncbi:hypothetical protein Ddye_002653 [Dipteronia dyeriana]|uniref:KIB1-4 beta-propeller domain-containing protein n=1 Tax=Dipteronia dyeriana TaxID=168575 RepID=A0AAD9XQS3_9ROSI|nr:hypothetical protein Ddye_002653 [Dipteronia dyeriana]
MLPSTEESNLYEFFRISEQIIPENPTHKTRLPRKVPGERCLSSKGWLIGIGQYWSVSLLHPFASLYVKLPNMITILNWNRVSHVLVIGKCFISASPLLTSDYIVIIIYGALGELAYARPGDKVWNPIKGWYGCYVDISCYKGRFYAINKCGMIMACNIKDDNPPTAQEVAHMPQEIFKKCLKQFYIVESAGVLLVVSRRQMRIRREKEGISEWSYGNIRFHVYEVDIDTNTWTEIKNLGSRALFLDHNSSFSIETSDVSHCKPNSIYFTPNSTMNPHSWLCNGRKDGMGIYDLKDGSVIQHYRGNSYSELNPPIWIEG